MQVPQCSVSLDPPLRRMALMGRGRGCYTGHCGTCKISHVPLLVATSPARRILYDSRYRIECIWLPQALGRQNLIHAYFFPTTEIKRIQNYAYMFNSDRDRACFVALLSF